MANPYMIAAKKSLRNFMAKDWRQGWQWAIEILSDDAPTDFDIYVKDVDFGSGSIDAETFEVGSGNIAFPKSSGASEITLTVRDDSQLTIDRWMDKRLKMVKNDDGTINLPIDYVFTVRFYMLDSDGNKTPYKDFQVFPTKKGNMNFTRDGVNAIHSFPLIFQKFSTVGKKVF